MKKDSKKDIQKKQISDEKYLEKLEILQKSKEVLGKQLTIDIDKGNIKEVDEIKELIGKNIDDPKEKYQLYYNGIEKILKKYLPTRKESESSNIIRDEKDIFLNRGKAKDKKGVRGSDGRMTYNEDMMELVNLISDWAMTSQDEIDLFKRLWELNEKYGYGHQNYDDTSESFHKAMSKIAKVPKPKE